MAVKHVGQYYDVATLSHHWLRLLIALKRWSIDSDAFAYGFFVQSYSAQLHTHYCHM